MALQPWLTGKIIRIENETADTRRFWIQSPNEGPFDFIPGQFVTLDLPIHEKLNKRIRSYSIASWPNGTNVFELLIVLDKKGTGTHYLFGEVKEGDDVVFRGPQGVFTLKEPLDKDIVMICTGTGIAPFRSMIHHIKNKQIPFPAIHLVFGCRTKNDLLYYNEFKELEKTMPGFHYHPVLSREEWEGHSGYVHVVYESLFADKRPARFLLCGWKGMIDEARERIAALGYDKSDVHFELYG